MKRRNSSDLHIEEDNDCVIKDDLRMQIKTRMKLY